MEPVAAPLPCCDFGGSQHSLQHSAPASVAILDEVGHDHQKCCIQPVTWYTMISLVRINWRGPILLPLLISLPVICSLVSSTITCSQPHGSQRNSTDTGCCKKGNMPTFGFFIVKSVYYKSDKVKLKCTLVQALRLCTGRTAHRGSRGIALRFRDQR